MWNVIVAYILDFNFGKQSANRHRDNLIALASRRATYQFGGSRQVSLPMVAAAQDVIDWIDIELDGTNLAGFTVRARIECRTDDVATSITPKVRNVTDAADAVVGAVCSSATFAGTNGTQTLVVPLAAGVKKYRLQGTPSDAVNPTYLIGYLEVFADA